MKKLFKLLRSIRVLLHKYTYLVLILAALFSVFSHDYTTLAGVATLALICIAIELRELNKGQTTTSGFDKMMYDISESLKKIILSPLHKKQKKCDLYDDISKCPDNKTCDKCNYLN